MFTETEGSDSAMAALPYSEACERNKDPILAVLQEVLAGCRRVLEIGSGTGQHAVYFARHLPQLEWRVSDLPENVQALKARLRREGPANVGMPVALDVAERPWPVSGVDGVFTANTFHIMSWSRVVDFFDGAGDLLAANGVLGVYGPFNYRGEHTSQSNAQFDQFLRQRDPAGGIRDFEAVNALAGERSLVLWRDYAMPANNRLLVWRRQS